MRRIYTALAIASLACIALLTATMPPLSGADPGAFLALAVFAFAVSAVALVGIQEKVPRSAGRDRRRTGIIPILRLICSPPTPYMRC